MRDGDSTVHDTEIEVGLLHRVHDTHTWLVIENGTDIHLDTAQSVAQALRDDPRLSSALGLASG